MIDLPFKGGFLSRILLIPKEKITSIIQNYSNNSGRYNYRKYITNFFDNKLLLEYANQNLFKDNFCAMPDNLLKLNINSLKSADYLLLASIFANMEYKDAQYIIDNIPDEGFKSTSDFKQSFPSYKFDEGIMHIDFSSSSFMLFTTFTYDSFSADSNSRIYYGANKNSYIISRTYNGI